jgi:transposase
MTWVGGDRIPPIPKNQGAPWTPELLKKVKRLFKEGHSYTEIAEEMGRSRQSIIYAVNYDPDMPKRVRSRWSRWSRVEKQLLHSLVRKGFTYKEISATFQYISLWNPHVKPRTIPSIRSYMGKYHIRTRRRSYANTTPKRHMKPWSPDEEEKLLRMYREGELISTIADELQRSKGSVRARLKRFKMGENDVMQIKRSRKEAARLQGTNT